MLEVDWRVVDGAEEGGSRSSERSISRWGVGRYCGAVSSRAIGETSEPGSVVEGCVVLTEVAVSDVEVEQLLCEEVSISEEPWLVDAALGISGTSEKAESLLTSLSIMA